jgi:hypothetical protein
MKEKEHVFVTSDDLNQPDTAVTSRDLIEYCRRKIIKTGDKECVAIVIRQTVTFRRVLQVSFYIPND